MVYFFQNIINALQWGSFYALIALAMVIIYKTSEIPNFGQGEMAMISTFVAFMLLVSYGHPFIISFFGTLLFAALLGVFLEFVFLRRAKDPNILSLILITLGFEMILYGLASWKWGADQRDLPFPVYDKIDFRKCMEHILTCKSGKSRTPCNDLQMRKPFFYFPNKIEGSG